MEDRWVKLEEIVRRVISEELDARGIKAKTKLAFVNGKWTGVTREQEEAWGAAYPSCDVQTELKKAAAWIVSNPHLAPKSQFGRFFNSWLLRQQNTLSIRSIPTRNDQKKPTKIGVEMCAYCEKVSSGIFAGILHCNEHLSAAEDRLPYRKQA